MVVDVRGVNTHNKGAHLMLLAVRAALPDMRLSMAPHGASFDSRSHLGLRQTLLLNGAPRLSALVGDLIPRSVRGAFGLTADSQITGVLDASGFAYSDSFDTTRSKRESIHAGRWAKRRVPLIALPQAFGPFTDPNQAKYSKSFLEGCTRIYARDDRSFEYVKSLSHAAKVQRAPDFTIALTPPPLPDGLPREYAAIVPNGKMVSHTQLNAAQYLDMLRDAAQTFREAGLEPVVVVHETGDLALGKQLAQAANAQLFQHDDPLVLKAVVGGASASVSSRFHAIVGALSMGTPVLAFGWSHKYEALLADFGVPGWSMTPEGNTGKSIEALLADGRAETLKTRKEELLVQVSQMWGEVRGLLADRP